uniref:Uncharacterized protein n=1 Tax=Alexandrium andersonii TaxID=327968 RepID=A0A7S2I518_9DINO|mmetsp:Transcript_79052/g.176817  ORF Transcript_79052/g.176817 Transcript_79052/m.176817 type:complete len:279 (+) Transcript_79052:2-838(+)
MDAVRRHAERVALARWRGAAVIAAHAFQHMAADGDPASSSVADEPQTRPTSSWEASSFSQRAELLGLSNGPVRAGALDSLGQQAYFSNWRRSRSLVSSQLSRQFLDLQAEISQRPCTSSVQSGAVVPGRAASINLCDAREGFVGRAYGRLGLHGRGQLSSARMPWECPTSLQRASPKLGGTFVENQTDHPDATRVATLNFNSLSTMDQVKALHWNSFRLSREKRLPPAGGPSPAGLVVTGERPGLLQSASTGTLGLRVQGKYASRATPPLPPQGCAAE